MHSISLTTILLIQTKMKIDSCNHATTKFIRLQNYANLPKIWAFFCILVITALLQTLKASPVFFKTVPI